MRLGSAGCADLERFELALARKVDGFAENAGRFLRRMETHGVFRTDEIYAPLRAALQFTHAWGSFER
jgi:hypothetical protein